MEDKKPKYKRITYVNFKKLYVNGQFIIALTFYKLHFRLNLYTVWNDFVLSIYRHPLNTKELILIKEKIKNES